MVAEAPATHLLQLARAEVAVNPDASRGIQEFAAMSDKHAEDGCHKIFRKYSFSAPVTIERLNVGEGPQLKQFPFVKFSTWAKHLLDTGRLPRQMCGAASLAAMRPILEEFWERYRGIYPRHEIFQLEGVDLGMTIPVFSHSDEGRSYKHEPIFLLSTHGCIGRGTKSYVDKKKHHVPLKRRGMGLNFIGNTWGTQFLSFAALRAVLEENQGMLEKLVAFYAEDMAKVIHEGICSDQGERVFFMHLGTKGDLPALAKLGKFKRTHSHVARQPSSKKPCTGICHLCQGGVEAPGGLSLFPWEDVSEQPAWGPTVNAVPPWASDPGILAGLPVEPNEKASFFKVDVWHCLHLGVSKHWCASSFVSLIERMNKFGKGSVEAAFQHLTDDFADFCKRKRMKAYMADISRESMSFPTNGTCPVGKWSKGLVATQYMLFLQDFCCRNVDGKTDDPVLLTIVHWFHRAYVLKVFCCWL